MTTNDIYIIDMSFDLGDESFTAFFYFTKLDEVKEIFLKYFGPEAKCKVEAKLHICFYHPSTDFTSPDKTGVSASSPIYLVNETYDLSQFNGNIPVINYDFVYPDVHIADFWFQEHLVYGCNL